MVSRYTSDSLKYGAGVSGFLVTLLGAALIFYGTTAAIIEGGQILMGLGVILMLVFFALTYPRLRGR